MKALMKIGIVLLCLFFSFSVLAEEKIDEGKRKDIEKLLEITGSGELGIQVMNQMLQQMKPLVKDVPEEFWEEFMAEVDPKDLNNLIIPIYDKYLTHDDIKGLLQFYDSPLGKKLISILPKITEESMIAGQQWGAMLGEKIAEKLRKKGYR